MATFTVWKFDDPAGAGRAEKLLLGAGRNGPFLDAHDRRMIDAGIAGQSFEQPQHVAVGRRVTR